MFKYLIIILLILIVLSLYIKIKNLKKYICIIMGIGLILLNGNNQNFINNKIYEACNYETQLQELAPYAQKSMQDYGIYASIIFAQYIVEGGMGQHASAFGHKIPNASNEKTCRNKGGLWLETTEYKDRTPYKIKACFEPSSGSKGDDVYNHGEWVATTFSNRRELLAATSLMGQLTALQSKPGAQYASSPDYLCSLIDWINSCDLTRFDDGISGGNISGSHLGPIDKTNCSSADIIKDTPTNNEVKKEHYTTSYGGDIEQGWLYFRTRKFDEYKSLNVSLTEEEMDETIDKIFQRAHASYVASNKEYCSKNNINAEDGGSINYGQGTGGSLPDYALDAFGCPVGGAGTCTITSGYGGRGDGHLAVDVAKSGNPPILAAADGTVTGVKVDNNNYYRGWDTVNNKPICDSHSANTIQITHEINGEKWITTYVHLDSIMVSNGQQVTKGEQIGTMGNTGCSSGDHLHFAITGPDNKNYNPTPIISKCS